MSSTSGGLFIIEGDQQDVDGKTCNDYSISVYTKTNFDDEGHEGHLCSIIL